MQSSNSSFHENSKQSKLRYGSSPGTSPSWELGYYTPGLEPQFFTAMNKIITPEKGFNLRLMPMWDGKEIYALNVIIEDEEYDRDADIILDVENVIELRDYLNELLN